MSIPVYRPTLKRRDMDAVLTCMVSDEIGPGSLADQFSKELSKYLNKKNGAAMRSPAEALAVLLKSLELPEGSRVAISALSPLFYLDALDMLRLTPVFVDVEESSACMSEAAIEKALEGEIAAWVLHEPFGISVASDAVIESGLPIIRDVSSTAVSLREREDDGADAYTLIRTEYCDPITTGGGAVVLAGGVKYRRQIKPLLEELTMEMLMPDINAALGLVQVQTAEGLHSHRAEIYDLLAQGLMKSKHRSFSSGSGEEGVVPTAFPVVIDTGMNEVRQYALKNGVQTENAFASSPYARLQPEEIDCPVAASLALRTILFPLYPSMGRKNTELLVRVLSTLP